jgi:hypothetical protein
MNPALSREASWAANRALEFSGIGTDTTGIGLGNEPMEAVADPGSRGMTRGKGGRGAFKRATSRRPKFESEQTESVCEITGNVSIIPQL